MEDKNHRQQKRRELNKRKNNRTVKKVLIALLLIVTIPTALGMGYVYYMANKIDSRHIDDPSWDSPLEDPVGTGENTTPGEDLIGTGEDTTTDNEELDLDSDGELDSDGDTALGENSEQDGLGSILNEDGYVITADGKVVTDLGTYETETEESDGKGTSSKDPIPDFIPPTKTDSLGIEKEVEAASSITGTLYFSQIATPSRF